jgi:hypothetical protein
MGKKNNIVKQDLKQWAKIHYVNPTSEKNSSQNQTG